MPLCTRKVGCIKEAGHPGWCKTKASKTKAVSQDDMLAAAAAKESLPSKRRAVSSSAVARAGGFRELSERHNAKKSRRTIAVCSDDEEYEDQGSEEYEAESDEGDTEWGGGGGRRPSRATGSGGVEYADHGMSRNERKAARSAGARRERYEEEGDGSEDEGAEYSGGPAAALHEVESIRLRRSALEKWLLEPFFSTVVRGCLVRIGLQVEAESGGGQSGAQTLYRVAEVVGVEEFEDQGYMLGARKTHKKLKLRFGEIDQWYPMASVSNQNFEEVELLAWQAVLEAAGLPPISAARVREKQKALDSASNYSYTEADVSKKIVEEQKQAHAPLTARQKFLEKNGGGGPAAKPMKMIRDKQGNAIVQER